MMNILSVDFALFSFMLGRMNSFLYLCGAVCQQGQNM